MGHRVQNAIDGLRMKHRHDEVGLLVDVVNLQTAVVVDEVKLLSPTKLKICDKIKNGTDWSGTQIWAFLKMFLRIFSGTAAEVNKHAVLVKLVIA